PSTAPNRRLADLINQRQMKAAIHGQPPVYSDAQLTEIAPLLQRKERGCKATQRQVQKSAAAARLKDKLGQRFGAVVTRVKPDGTLIRLLSPQVEGKLVGTDPGLEVGQRIQVALQSVHAEQGTLDFTRIQDPPPRVLLAP
ncbi:MAG: hypothetical protein AB1758_36185, partial [Candidatus Eremiobacterota bacterium]